MPRTDTTRMIVSSRARRAAATAALNRIPTTASAVAAASRTSAAARGLMAGQTAAAYCPAAEHSGDDSVQATRGGVQRPQLGPAHGQAAADQGREQEGQEGAAALLA